MRRQLGLLFQMVAILTILLSSFPQFVQAVTYSDSGESTMQMNSSEAAGDSSTEEQESSTESIENTSGEKNDVEEETAISGSRIQSHAAKNAEVASASVTDSVTTLAAGEVNSLETLLTAISEAPDNVKTTIKIIENIAVTKTISIPANKKIQFIATKNVYLYYQMTSRTESIVRVARGATLIVGENSLDAGQVIFDGNGIGGGNLIYNSGNLYLNHGIIQGGTDNEASQISGGIYNSGFFEMNGGSIQDNVGNASNETGGGGGLYTIGEFIMNGGKIINNTTGTADTNLETKKGNGGGIFVKGGKITLNAGTIANNTAGSGGGIYIYGVSNLPGEYAEATFGNGLVTENTATLQGGGVWLCQTGEVGTYDNDSTSVVGNTAKISSNYRSGGDDYYSEKKTDESYIVGLPETSNNGEVFKYYEDKSGSRYSETASPVEVNLKDEKWTETVLLHVGTENIDTEALKSSAALIIQGNSAREGGGIASNGMINFGYKPAMTNIKVEKKLSGKDLTEGQFKFQITGADDGFSKIVRNDANGVINSGIIEYNTAGTYHYTITEINDDQANISYDDLVVEVTVVVEYQDGVLTAREPVYSSDTTFNNKYEPTEITESFEATKKLTGKTLTAGQFSFELVTEEDPEAVLQTVKNDVDGKIKFDGITYTKAGTCNYLIREVNDKQANISYDDLAIKVTVKVTDTDGVLSAKVTYSSDTTFNNEYEPTEITESFEATKKLTGKILTAGQFSFELVTEENPEAVLQTVKNDVDGNIKFDGITYTKAGTYNYLIREVNDKQANISYDDLEIKVTVKVTDTDGVLSAKVSYSSDTTFNNKYEPTEITESFEATKKLTGKTLTDGQFSFELVTEENPEAVLQTVKNDVDGKIKFDGITYTKAGTYNYLIREVNDKQANISYDDLAIKVTVKVTDTDGVLSAKVTYSSDTTFNNKYEPTEIIESFEATKKLTGRTLTAGQFSFELVTEENPEAVLQTVKNDVDGKIKFDGITYTKAGTYNYLIREVNDKQANISYDDLEIKVTVEVTDTDGVLSAKVTYSSDTTFNNKYEPTKITESFEATKKLTGKTLTTDQFSFELVTEEEPSTVLQTVKNDAAGNIKFEGITYTKAGTYNYLIREVNDKQANISYDDLEIKVTVEVTDTDGVLSSEVTYSSETTFNNKYMNSIVLKANKELKGKNLAANQFSFSLTDSSGKVLQTVKNDASGNIVFEEISYSEDGDYDYIIKEINDKQANIDYDTHEIKVTVTVKDGKTTATYDGDVTFSNQYEPSTTTEGGQLPNTGKTTTKTSGKSKGTLPSTGMVVSSGLFTFGLLAVVGSIVGFSKKNKK